MKRLGVNIDHIATLRNARREKHPDLCHAAKAVVKMGANSITIHLREDRRHIKDLDAKKICNLKNILVNLEVSMNKDIINKTGVVLLPGSEFGFPKEKMLARLSFTDFDGENFLNNTSGCNEINQATLSKFAPKIVEGVSKLKNWAEKI